MRVVVFGSMFFLFGLTYVSRLFAGDYFSVLLEKSGLSLKASLDEKKWEALDKGEKSHILEFPSYQDFTEVDWKGMKTIRFNYNQGEISADKIYYIPYRDYFKKIDKFMDTNAGVYDVETYDHSGVGYTQVSEFWLLVRASDHKIFGGGVSYTYEGCDMPDLTGEWFETVEEAENAGCEFSDVSWGTYAIFDENGEDLEWNYMEWTGY